MVYKAPKGYEKKDDYIALPFDIETIEVFGSITRGKENPGDLDLILIRKQNIFAELIDKALGYYYMMPENYKKFKGQSVSEGIRVSLSNYLTSNKIDFDTEFIDRLILIFNEWYPKIEWNWFVYNIGYHNSPDPRDFQKVMNRLVFSRYHVKPFEYQTKEDKYSKVPKSVKKFMLWSKEKPEICENLKSILLRPNIEEDIISELLEFNKRIKPVNEYMPKVCEKLGLKWEYPLYTFNNGKKYDEEDLKHYADYVRKSMKTARYFEIIFRSDFTDGEYKPVVIEEILERSPKTAFELARRLDMRFTQNEMPLETKQSIFKKVGLNPILANNGVKEGIDEEDFFLLTYRRSYKPLEGDYEILHGEPMSEWSKSYYEKYF